jgi:hypothetical protein
MRHLRQSNFLTSRYCTSACLMQVRNLIVSPLIDEKLLAEHALRVQRHLKLNRSEVKCL